MNEIKTNIQRKGTSMKKKPEPTLTGVQKLVKDEKFPIRKKYGTEKENPPKGIDMADLVWIDNKHAHNYGWNESDNAFQRRIKESYDGKEKKSGRKNK